MLPLRTHGYRMCARVSPIEGSGEARRGEARRAATLRSLWSHVSALLRRESDNVYAATNEKARIRVRLRRNTVAQFARLRHGRLVNSAARNQTPRTPSSRSCIPISPVASTTPHDKFARNRGMEDTCASFLSRFVPTISFFFFADNFKRSG